MIKRSDYEDVKKSMGAQSAKRFAKASAGKSMKKALENKKEMKQAIKVKGYKNCANCGKMNCECA